MTKDIRCPYCDELFASPDDHDIEQCEREFEESERVDNQLEEKQIERFTPMNEAGHEE